MDNLETESKEHILMGIIILIAIVFTFYLNVPSESITNFEECIAAGNPAMESYPRQCRDPISDRTFVEIIDDWWRLDDINLMEHESEDLIGCFGCSQPVNGTAMCVDPIFGMVFIEETAERYCNEDFEIIE